MRHLPHVDFIETLFSWKNGFQIWTMNLLRQGQLMEKAKQKLNANVNKNCLNAEKTFDL